MKPKFRVTHVSWQEAEADLRRLRETVFIQEQHVAEALEWDGKDADCQHVLAFDQNNKPIGTARITPDGQIGRMAVLPEYRRQGVGSALLVALTTLAKRAGLERVELNAQIRALPFYERYGFVVDSEEFMDAGIPHRHMYRLLGGTGNTEAETELASQVLGTSTGPVYLHTRADNREAALRLVEQASRTLHLFTRDLDPSLFDTAPFIEATKQLALASPRSKVYILIQDPTSIVKRGHRIIELARRINSHVFLHRAADEDKDRLDNFLVVDDMGVLTRPHGDRFEGSANFYAPADARLLLKYFKEAWERSQPEAELRRLHL